MFKFFLTDRTIFKKAPIPPKQFFQFSITQTIFLNFYLTDRTSNQNPTIPLKQLIFLLFTNSSSSIHRLLSTVQMAPSHWRVKIIEQIRWISRANGAGNSLASHLLQLGRKTETEFEGIGRHGRAFGASTRGWRGDVLWLSERSSFVVWWGGKTEI